MIDFQITALYYINCDWIGCDCRGTRRLYTSCVILSAGPDGGARLTHLHHAAGSACETPGGPDTGGHVWKCHLSFWTRLFHPEEAPEDHRRGSCHHSSRFNIRANGAGKFMSLYSNANTLKSALRDILSPRYFLCGLVCCATGQDRRLCECRYCGISLL